MQTRFQHGINSKSLGHPVDADYYLSGPFVENRKRARLRFDYRPLGVNRKRLKRLRYTALRTIPVKIHVGLLQLLQLLFVLRFSNPARSIILLTSNGPVFFFYADGHLKIIVIREIGTGSRVYNNRTNLRKINLLLRTKKKNANTVSRELKRQCTSRNYFIVDRYRKETEGRRRFIFPKK